MVFIIANTGTPISMPINPAILAEANKIRITVSGWIESDFPTKKGVKKLLSPCWTIRTNKAANSPRAGDSIKPTITAGTAPIKGPTYGMKFVIPAKTDSKNAGENPEIVYKINSSTPTISDAIPFPLI